MKNNWKYWVIVVPGLVILPHGSGRAQEGARDVSRVTQLIDGDIDGTLTANGIKPSGDASDAEFLRRVSLDIIGHIPTAEKAEAFLLSKDPDRRRKLIDELLGDPQYGEHFAGIWTDMIQATGTPPQSMKSAFHQWLSGEFNQNRGWDRIAHAMLTAEGTAPAGYFVRANYKEPGQVANTTARFFLGVRIECAECHDHPYHQWKQTDFWGLAAFFTRVKQIRGKGGNLLTEDPIPGKKTKNPTAGAGITIPGTARDAAGKVIMARYLGGTEPKLPDEGAIRPPLAEWVVAKDNPYFAQAAVNRVWAHLFGRGIVNPIDDFHADAVPSHPALLRELAREFTDSGFDLKHLIRCITSSRAYQRTSRPLAENRDDTTLFSHMPIKIMKAGVLFDSLVTAMGNPKMPGGLAAPLPYEVYAGGASRNSKPRARDEFIRFFDTSDDSGDTTAYTHGIPQILALMNANQFNTTPPIVDKLTKAKVRPEKGVQTLFLATLTRMPTDGEMKLMTGYLERRQDPAKGYTGILWILFNTNEFVLNH